MILINIKMQIRPEKMSEWLALADSYAKDVNSDGRAACSSSSPGALPTTTSSSVSRASPMPGRVPRMSSSPT